MGSARPSTRIAFLALVLASCAACATSALASGGSRTLPIRFAETQPLEFGRFFSTPNGGTAVLGCTGAGFNTITSTTGDVIPIGAYATTAVFHVTGDLNSFFQSLTTWDRWAAGSSAALLLVLALPWRWTREDEEIIGLVAAWPIALLAVSVLVLVYLRSRANAALDRRLRLAQLSSSAMALITNLLFLSWASQQHAVRGAGRTVAIALSRPEIGAYLGLACAAAALLASMPLLKSEA